MKFVYGGSCKIGVWRDKNQDTLYIRTFQRLNKNFCLSVICDGIGALEYSEKVGIILTEELNKWFDKNIISLTGLIRTNRNLVHCLKEELYRINNYIVNQLNLNEIIVGSTLSVLFIVNKKYYLIHIGDTRIYKVSKEIEQLSRDHVLVQKNIIDGRVVQFKKKLIKFFGQKEDIDFFYKKGIIHKGDVFVLCTDGVYEKININQMKQLLDSTVSLEQQNLMSLADKITEYAILNGSRDNLTIGIIKII